MKRRTAVILGLLAVLGVAAVFREEPRLLLGGWLVLLCRNAGKVTVNLAGVATGVVAILLLLGMVHYLGRWWCRATSGGVDAPRRRWRFRWSISLVVLLFVMFAAGFAAVGLARQLGWLLSSHEPIYAERLADRYGDSSANLKLIGLGLATYHDARGTYPTGGQVAQSGQMRPPSRGCRSQIVRQCRCAWNAARETGPLGLEPRFASRPPCSPRLGWPRIATELPARETELFLVSLLARKTSVAVSCPKRYLLALRTGQGRSADTHHGGSCRDRPT